MGDRRREREKRERVVVGRSDGLATAVPFWEAVRGYCSGAGVYPPEKRQPVAKIPGRRTSGEREARTATLAAVLSLTGRGAKRAVEPHSRSPMLAAQLLAVE